MSITLDSRTFQGGTPVLAGITPTGQLGFTTGAALEATLDTPETIPNPGGRAFIRGVVPRVRMNGTYAAGTNGMGVSIGKRERIQSPIVFGTEQTMNEATGMFSIRASGREFTFRVRIDAGATWTHAQGVEIDAKADGRR